MYAAENDVALLSSQFTKKATLTLPSPLWNARQSSLGLMNDVVCESLAQRVDDAVVVARRIFAVDRLGAIQTAPRDDQARPAGRSAGQCRRVSVPVIRGAAERIGDVQEVGSAAIELQRLRRLDLQVLVRRKEMLDRHEQSGISLVYVVERRQRRKQHLVLDNRIGERVLEDFLFRPAIGRFVGRSVHFLFSPVLQRRH